MSLSRRIASKLRDAVAGSCRAGLLADLGGGSRRRLLQTATPEATTGATQEATSIAEATLADKEKLRMLIRKQIQLEATAMDMTLQRYNEMSKSAKGRYAGGTLPAAKRLLAQWYKPLVGAIEREQELCRSKAGGVDRRQYGEVFVSLSAKELAIITLHSLLSLLMRGENQRVQDDEVGKVHEAGVIRTVKAVSYIGDAVQSQINLERLKRASREMRKAKKKQDPGQPEKGNAVTDGRLAAAADGAQASSSGASVDPADEVADAIAPLYSDAEERNADWILRPERLRGLTDARSVRNHLVGVDKSVAKRYKLNDMDGKQRIKVGSALLAILMETCKVRKPGPVPGQFVAVPAFHTSYVADLHSGALSRRYGSIWWDDAVMNIINDESIVRLALQPKYLPMLVPARPWTRFNDGGHLVLESLMMRGGYSRLGPSVAQLKDLERMQRDMDKGAEGCRKVMQALTILGQTPWRVNEKVLNVMEEAWVKLGGGIAGLPPREDMFLPIAPSRVYTLRRRAEGSDGSLGRPSLQLLVHAHVSEKEIEAYKRATKKVRQKNRELQSLRCDFVYKLQVAIDLRNAEAIYYPHNVDFRGRAYTMHPHLNHLGADSCRGLLTFADGRPLGKDGLRWLLIQAANTFAQGGVDKFTLDKRAEWAWGKLDAIMDSADRPLDGQRFWAKAEDPWQFLAACFEIRDAVRSGDPESFVSRLPCHQDGSCNGLQHYAALGRDESGGRSVNVLPGEKPADVYSGIAEVLKQRVASDLMSGDPKKVQIASIVLEHVDRKLVKQTVMTSVYGVTFVGARMQIQNRLKERGALPNEKLRYEVACYAAKQTIASLRDMFSNARAVMDWLTGCAMVISNAGETVRWRTPLGLPVVQPYRTRSKALVRTVLQTFSLQSEDETRPVTKAKQRSAFPPNFIHSVDSSHMMLTAIGCHEAGLTFAGVHDSFWTHAASVPEMNHILREKFIELHNAPMLERLYEAFKKEYPAVALEFRAPPETGSLDLEKVRESVYFFS